MIAICTSRPQLLDRRPNFGRTARNVTHIQLRPLRHDAATKLAYSLLPAEASILADRVAATAGGNPFFAEEVSRTIVEGARNVAVETLPDTVQGAVAARLDLLRPAEKRVLQHAAVLGQAVDAETLRACWAGKSVSEALEVPGSQGDSPGEEPIGEGGALSLRHQLMRDVAYASLPPRAPGAAALTVPRRWSPPPPPTATPSSRSWWRFIACRLSSWRRRQRGQRQRGSPRSMLRWLWSDAVRALELRSFMSRPRS